MLLSYSVLFGFKKYFVLKHSQVSIFEDYDDPEFVPFDRISNIGAAIYQEIDNIFDPLEKKIRFAMDCLKWFLLFSAMAQKFQSQRRAQCSYPLVGLCNGRTPQYNR